MFSTIQSAMGKLPMETCRNYCIKSLVLRKKPRKKNLTKMAVDAVIKKKMAKMKTTSITCKASDHCEEIWLNDLKYDNLKLYRKTSFGSFRKINVDNLVAKLKAIHPSLISDSVQREIKSKEPKADLLGNGSSSSERPLDNTENDLAFPQMSEFLIKHMLEFPMIQSAQCAAITKLFEDEKEDYGVVDSVKFPSVTRILQETMSEGAKKKLEDWKKEMILKMGAKEFHKYSKDLLAQGAKLHRCLRTYLETGSKDAVVVDADIEGCWSSLDKLLPDITNVKMVEESVHHPVLMYKGVVDCVANYQEVPCVIEWKKSGKLKNDLSATYDAPLQLCAYLGALSWQKSFVPSTQGLVVVAYTCGSPANAFLMDVDSCQLYWMQWLRRLQTYWLNKSSVLIRKESEI